MSDKIDELREAAIQYGGAVGTAGRLRQYHEIMDEAERALRAENETWKATAIQADNLRYEAANALNAALAENERLRAALERIAQWDCLNPPVSHITCVRDASDFTWLRGVVDEALRPT